MKSWLLAISLLVTNLAMGQTIADGLRLIDRDQPSRAKQVFEGLVTASPTGENYYYLGYYYLSRRDWAGAEDAFKKALSIRADYVEAIIGLGNLYSKNKQEQKVVDLYRAHQREPC